METYDVVVVGLGVVGSSVLYAAARRGLRVCGIEQFDLNHARGSSHGESRIIRKAYFLHPNYVPLLNRAYDLWKELENSSKEELLVLNGVICAGEPSGPLIKGLEVCYSTHPLPYERLASQEAMRRWPQFHLPADWATYFDPQGGFIRADRALASLRETARTNGAVIYDQEPMVDWKDSIKTTRRAISAGHLILASGSWILPEMKRLGVELKIKRKASFWYSLKDSAKFKADRFPAYICESNGHEFYGVPSLDGVSMKAAEHGGGETIDNPENVVREYRSEDETELRRFLDRIFPGDLVERASMQTCLYTMSGDSNFVIGNHPENTGVTLASCCSGHAFKLGPVLGEVILDTALNGVVPSEAAFLSMARMQKGSKQ